MKLEKGMVTRNLGIAIENVESAIPHSYSSFIYTDIYTYIYTHTHFITKNVMPTIKGISGIMMIHTSGDFML